MSVVPTQYIAALSIASRHVKRLGRSIVAMAEQVYRRALEIKMHKIVRCILLRNAHVSPMSQALTLHSDGLVASGRQRFVYLHPHDPTKLVKVLRSADQMQRRRGFSGTMDHFFPSTRVRQIRKEYSEYLRVMLSDMDMKQQPPIAHMYGFAVTNLGVGCVTERITKSDGSIGDTLAQVIQSGKLTDTHLELLNDTIGRIYSNGVRASDMNSKNFVFGHRNNGDGRGPEECVLVDGFGDIHAVPVRSMGRFPNRIGLDDSCKRLARKNGLEWNNEIRQFTR